MTSVTHFAQFLRRLDPQQNSARLSFYHFLNNLCDLTAPLSPQLILNFYLHALKFPYWQKSKEHLGQVLREDFERFHQEHDSDLKKAQIRHADQLQLVALDDSVDLHWLVRDHLAKTLKGDFQIRLIHLSDQKILALIKRHSGGLLVQSFGHEALILNGHLQPLAPSTNLEYNSQLDLMPHRLQFLEGPMKTTCRFEITDSGVQGLSVKGHLFQRQDSYSAQSIYHCSDLFYALKTVERHYVNPQSEPAYQELISLMEQTYYKLNDGHPESKQLAPEALRQRKNALKNLFPQDKLLLLLVANIEYTLREHELNGHRNPSNGSSSEQQSETFSWQKPNTIP